MKEKSIVLITGTRKGIGRYLAEYYVKKGMQVIGCSRSQSDFQHENYEHFCLDIANEAEIRKMFSVIFKKHKKLDVLINNAGVASMNHSLLTPIKTVHKLVNTNFIGTFLMCREAAKLMKIKNTGRIVNFVTVAIPLHLDGEAVYAATKASVVSLTQILSREFASFGITVNAIGPTPVETDLIRSVPKDKIDKLINRQAIKRFGEMEDISNVIDFFIKPESNFITSQIIYLGGIS